MSRPKYKNTTIEKFLFDMWNADKDRLDLYMEINKEVDGTSTARINHLDDDSEVAEFELDPKDNKFKLQAIYSNRYEDLD